MGETVLCVVCRRRQPASGWVCDGDRDQLASLLADLPRKLAALRLEIVPGPAPAAERVSTSRTGSPMPGRADALSLNGRGAAVVSPILHPQIRRWQVEHTVEVTVPGREPQRRTVIEWCQELAVDEWGQPILVGDDDQIGVLPPAEWLGWWAKLWRAHFGHAAPVAVQVPQGREAVWRAMLTADPRYSPATAAMVTDWRRYAARTVLGLDTHQRSVDPLADEWEIRFGEPPRDAATDHHIAYLALWLPAACEQDLDVATFAAELRTLSAELTRVLGERPDQQWLGRCPASIADVPDDDGVAGKTRPCGAGLWQDPHASQVQCPRCHATWSQTQILRLAYDIRRVWPVDRRRRYTTDEASVVRRPRCPVCGETVRIEWRNVTATTDRRMWWQPDKAVCVNDCDTGKII